MLALIQFILVIVVGVVILALLYVVCMAGDAADTIERRDDEQ